MRFALLCLLIVMLSGCRQFSSRDGHEPKSFTDSTVIYYDSGFPDGEPGQLAAQIGLGALNILSIPLRIALSPVAALADAAVISPVIIVPIHLGHHEHHYVRGAAVAISSGIILLPYTWNYAYMLTCGPFSSSVHNFRDGGRHRPLTHKIWVDGWF